MSRSGPTRSLLGQIWKNIVKSINLRQNKGNYIGDDYHGNKYFEIPADPSRGKRRPKRFYVPPEEMRYDQDKMPAEWDAWLRYRRETAPSEDELKSNLAVSMLKKENADKIAQKEGKQLGIPEKHSHMSSYPVYEEYEATPGDKSGLK